jgi:hypothetical protein
VEFSNVMGIRVVNPVMRAAIPSTSSLDAGRRTVAVGLVAASATPGMVDATCMVDARPEHREARAMAVGVAGSTRRQHGRNDDVSAS